MIFETSSEKTVSGTWLVEDALWNYLDVPHLNHVHSQVSGKQLFLSDEVAVSVVVQRIGPVKLRTPLVVWRAAPNSIKYATSFAGLTLEVNTELRPQESGAVAQTKYTVSSGPMLRPLHRIAHFLLARNFEILMKEDLPMRERRAKLRASGAVLKGDRDGYGFLESKRITSNRISPSDDGVLTIDMSKRQGGSEMWSKDEFSSGLTIYHSGPDEGDKVHIALGYCPHEGAELAISGDCPVGPTTVICPWHGRSLPSKQLSDKEKVTYHGLNVERDGFLLTISWQGDPGAKESRG